MPLVWASGGFDSLTRLRPSPSEGAPPCKRRERDRHSRWAHAAILEARYRPSEPRRGVRLSVAAQDASSTHPFVVIPGRHTPFAGGSLAGVARRSSTWSPSTRREFDSPHPLSDPICRRRTSAATRRSRVRFPLGSPRSLGVIRISDSNSEGSSRGVPPLDHDRETEQASHAKGMRSCEGPSRISGRLSERSSAWAF
jgi:hypothetical protein